MQLENNVKHFAQILSDIHDLVVDESFHDFPEESADIILLKEAYGVNSEEIVVLALLMHNFPNPVSEVTLKTALDGMNVSPQLVCRDLITRNFIKIISGASFFTRCYAMTREAQEAIIINRKYGYRFMEDCVEELKTCELASVVSKRWVECFTRSLDLPSNEHIHSAVDTMRILEFTEDVQIAFWVIARHFTHHFLEPLAYRNDEDVLGEAPYSQWLLKDSLAILVKEGLVITLPIEPLEDTKDTDRFVLAPKAAGLLFHGHEELIRYDEISKYGNVIKAKDITEKQLFFSDETQEEINHLRKMISKEGFERVRSILRRQKRNAAIQSLLWGHPGTGKTEVVKQIARETGRDIILFDVSKVTASAWGAAEKFYRAIFRAYNYMAEISLEVPIFLMNEADTILGKRLSNLGRAIDKSENALSNILLQEFEDMSGILLATTNLIDNLDEAFNRRFLFKTQMRKPDACARYLIWKENISSLTDKDARTLADKYEMSGAQISNVATKWNLSELYYEGSRDLAYVEKICQAEIATEKGGNTYRKIGF